jgi:polyhydroxyalkanoate synthesis regulator phasin
MRDRNWEAILYPEDYAAADEVMKQRSYPADKVYEVRKHFAECHAKNGDLTFRIQQGLQPPKSPYELYLAAIWRNELTREQFRDGVEDDLQQPVNEMDLEFLSESLDSTFDRFADFLQSVVENARMTRMNRGVFHLEKRIDYLARELRHAWPCDKRWSAKVSEHIEEARSRRGLRPVGYGELQAPTAYLLVTVIIRQAAGNWQTIRNRCYGTHRNIRLMEPGQAAREFADAVLTDLPPILTMQTLIGEEIRIARQDLREASASSPTSKMSVNKVSGAKEVPPAMPQLTSAERRKVLLNRWALAMETHQRWWLISTKNGDWARWRRIKIPKGKVEAVLEQLVQKGSLTRKEAIEALLPLLKGKGPERRSKAVTVTLSKARLLIRKKIAERLKRPLDDVPDPLPAPAGECRPEIAVGIATEDEGKLKFELHRRLR